MTTWRLLRHVAQTGAWNMAVDETLLEQVGQGLSGPVLRLYRWQPATVSLGFGQRGVKGVDVDACADAGVDVVRRVTGGRAVLHDHEVTYAVIAPEGVAPFSGGIQETYAVISRPILAMLHRCGLNAQLVPARRKGERGGYDGKVCFAAPAGYEIVVQGCKVAGSAQCRRDGAFLQHGSIPLDLDLSRLHRLLGEGHTTPDELADSVGWLNRWLRTPLSLDDAESLLAEAFAEVLGIRLRSDDLTAAERSRAEELVRQRYGCSTWTCAAQAGRVGLDR